MKKKNILRVIIIVIGTLLMIGVIGITIYQLYIQMYYFNNDYDTYVQSMDVWYPIRVKAFDSINPLWFFIIGIPIAIFSVFLDKNKKNSKEDDTDNK